jgi:hypothetical protein
MAEKKAFILRINPEVLKEIETWADEEFRSSNGQIEYLLQQALLARKKAKKKGDKSEALSPKLSKNGF